MNRGLRRKRGIESFGFGFSGYVDDAAPSALDHLWQQRVSDLPVTGEIQRDGFIPIAVGCIHRQRSAATGVVDQYTDVTHCGERSGRKLLCSILLHDVLHDRDHGGTSLRHDLLGKLLKPILPPGPPYHPYSLAPDCLVAFAAHPAPAPVPDPAPVL